MPSSISIPPEKQFPKSRNKRSFGAEAEEAAANYLEKQGFRILERNYRGDRCEIDIVAESEGTLVFVEVKAAAGANIPPETRVNSRKVKNLVRAAQAYIMEKGLEAVSCRFDLLAMYKTGGLWRINHLKDAFRP